MSSTRLVIIGLALILLGLPSTVRGLRTGRLSLRGGRRIDRHRQPVWFWWSLSLAGVASLCGLAMVVWGLVKEPT